MNVLEVSVSADEMFCQAFGTWSFLFYAKPTGKQFLHPFFFFFYISSHVRLYILSVKHYIESIYLIDYCEPFSLYSEKHFHIFKKLSRTWTFDHDTQILLISQDICLICCLTLLQFSSKSKFHSSSVSLLFH